MNYNSLCVLPLKSDDLYWSENIKQYQVFKELRTDLKLARKMKVKQKQVETPAQADLTDTGKISPTRTQGTGPRPSVKEKVKPASCLSIIFLPLH